MANLLQGSGPRCLDQFRAAMMRGNGASEEPENIGLRIYGEHTKQLQERDLALERLKAEVAALRDAGKRNALEDAPRQPGGPLPRLAIEDGQEQRGGSGAEEQRANGPAQKAAAPVDAEGAAARDPVGALLHSYDSRETERKAERKAEADAKSAARKADKAKKQMEKDAAAKAATPVKAEKAATPRATQRKATGEAAHAKARATPMKAEKAATPVKAEKATLTVKGEKSAARTKAKATPAKEPRPRTPHWGFERSRGQLMCRTGLEGPNQCHAIKFKEVGGEAKAVRMANAWVLEQNAPKKARS